jgi:hypothetical protein
MWKQDTTEDINTIIKNDKKGDLDPSLLMKDPNDVLNSIDVIKNHFKML